MGEITPHILGMKLPVVILLFIVGILGGGVGYYLGKRFSRRDSSSQSSRPPESYTAFLKGIHYILANETDQAIEAFSRAVKINSESIETYVALGNLFRAKGEIDRAVRIRQSILLRPRVDSEIKLQALFDLGMDYKQGGFLQRAISTFEEVIRRAPQRLQAFEELEGLYEAARDWRRALELQKEICKLSKKSGQHILAHLQTEWAKSEMKTGNLDTAKSHLKKALSLNSDCVDARLQLGEFYWLKNKKKKALAVWQELIQNNSQWAHLVLARLEEVTGVPADEARLQAFLEKTAGENLDALAHLALARCFMRRNQKMLAVGALKRALEIDPELEEARKVLGDILLEDGDNDGAVEEYRELLRHLRPTVTRYRCQHCGFATDKALWKCPGCQKWDSIQPTKASTGSSRKQSSAH